MPSVRSRAMVAQTHVIPNTVISQKQLVSVISRPGSQGHVQCDETLSKKHVIYSLLNEAKAKSAGSRHLCSSPKAYNPNMIPVNAIPLGGSAVMVLMLICSNHW